MKSILYLLTIFQLSLANASTLRVGLESITPNVGGYQIDDKGENELFSFNPGLRIETKATFFSVTTHLGASLFLPTTSEDSLYDITYLKIDGRYRFFSKDRIQLFLGLGLYSKIISGSGENLTLQNGNSTSNFFGPSQTRFNYFFTPEFATRFFFSTKLASTLSVSAQDLFEKDRMSWNYLIDVTWRIF